MLDIPLRIITNIDPHNVFPTVEEAIRSSGGSIDDSVVKNLPCYSHIIYFRLPVEKLSTLYSLLEVMGLELTEESKALLTSTNNGRDFGGMWMEDGRDCLIAKVSVKLTINVISLQSE